MSDISEDPQLSSEEKEFFVRVNKSEDKIDVFTEIASVARHLRTRDDFIETDVRTVEGNVVAIKGKLPLGVLKIQQNERKHGSFSNIVAEHNNE